MLQSSRADVLMLGLGRAVVWRRTACNNFLRSCKTFWLRRIIHFENKSPQIHVVQSGLVTRRRSNSSGGMTASSLAACGTIERNTVNWSHERASAALLSVPGRCHRCQPVAHERRDRQCQKGGISGPKAGHKQFM